MQLHVQVRPCASPSSPLFPTSLGSLPTLAPPIGSLMRRLAPCCTPDTFDEVGVQSACLEFMADMLNLQQGFLADSSHPSDLAARQTWELMTSFEEDARLRCSYISYVELI